MSKWRREAAERLPELKRIIASRIVDNPMMLWIELNQEFERLSNTEPIQLELMKRIWNYCKWCMAHKSQDVQTAAALGFAEHLLDSESRRKILPKIIGRSDFLSLRSLLEYHNSSDKVDVFLNSAWNIHQK